MMIKKKKSIICVLLFFGALFLMGSALYKKDQKKNESTLHKVQFLLTDEPIDVVIPCTKKDLFTLEKCIEGIRNNGENIRRVIVLSSEKLTDQAEWFDEAYFPFSKKEVALWMFKQNEEKSEKYLRDKKNRSGWIFQQLLKLYSPVTIPDISANVLILDADTIFLNKVPFQNKQKGAFFTYSKEYHEPYFHHAKRLIPGFEKISKYSGVAHHMLFQRDVIQDLFNQVEKKHQKPFWQSFCWCIDLKEVYRSSCSEYEIYSNYAQMRSNQFTVRSLKWLEISEMDHLDRLKQEKYNYISSHEYLRNPI